MRLSALSLILALCVAPAANAASPPPPEPPIEVMVLGVFHLSNPGRDLHDVHPDDVLAPKRQAEIAAITAGLAKFRPTKVMAEWPAELVAERYPKYLAGTLGPSRNEVVQLGFRLAHEAGAKAYGIDADGDFPYPRITTYADAHGLSALLKADDELIVRDVAREQALVDHGTLQGAFRDINDPARLAHANAWYREMLRVGAGQDQPGADLLTAWYRRNFLICANLVQLAKPGDRIVVIFGSGHAFLLRQCVSETPGLKLVEPNAYLAK